MSLLVDTRSHVRTVRQIVFVRRPGLGSTAFLADDGCSQCDETCGYDGSNFRFD